MCRGLCTGDGSCPDCNPEYAAVMKMNTTDYAAWLTRGTEQRAAELGIRVASMRVGVHATDDTDEQLASMAAFRRSFYDTAFAVLEPATSDVHMVPPDPYEAALEQLRKESR